MIQATQYPFRSKGRRGRAATRLLHAYSTERERQRWLRSLLEPNVSLDFAWHNLNAERLRERAANATVEALMFSLRSGVSALRRADTLRRLSELSDAQLREIAVRLQKFQPEIAPAWTVEDVEILVGVRSRLHGKDAGTGRR